MLKVSSLPIKEKEIVDSKIGEKGLLALKSVVGISCRITINLMCSFTLSSFLFIVLIVFVIARA